MIFFFVILSLKSLILSFSFTDMSFLFKKSGFFYTNLGLPSFFRVFVIDML